MTDEEYIRTKLRYDPTTGMIRRVFKKGERTLRGTDSEGYGITRVNRRAMRLHRVAWFLHYGEWPTNHLDHINGNKMDNRIENLRICDDYFNAANVGKNKHPASKSKYKGVGWHRGKWRARIKHRGQRIELGHFATEEEAFLAYCFKAAEMHGEFFNVQLRNDADKLYRQGTTRKYYDAAVSLDNARKAHEEATNRLIHASKVYHRCKDAFDNLTQPATSVISDPSPVIVQNEKRRMSI